MNGNRKGPEEAGSKTGRGLGFCTGHNAPGRQYEEDGFEMVRGMGMGRNAGCGRGRGKGRFGAMSRRFGRGFGRGKGMRMNQFPLPGTGSPEKTGE